jgi:hypothetical protein
VRGFSPPGLAFARRSSIEGALQKIPLDNQLTDFRPQFRDLRLMV